jgi:hypothetical protein
MYRTNIERLLTLFEFCETRFRIATKSAYQQDWYRRAKLIRDQIDDITADGVTIVAAYTTER